MDPDDWDAFRKLAHRMLDTMLDQFQQLDDSPTWIAPPTEVVTSIQGRALPRAGIGEEAAFEEFCKTILPYGNGSWHPRFLGWVQGTGMPLGMLADMLASGLNSHMAGFNTAPKWIELQVIQWVAEMVGCSIESSGILTSGGSMANILALHVAREQALKRGFSIENCRLYASDQTHGWLVKGLRFLGFAPDAWRVIPSIAGSIDTEQLQAAIERDRTKGLSPFLVIGNVGTVNTGAIDSLDSLHRICKEFGLWFHLDGAFGALAYQVKEYQPILARMKDADSLAVDLHKWMYLPFDIGCVLIKDPGLHLEAFASTHAYMAPTNRGLLAGGVPLADRTVELTRSFRALKAWLCVRAYGMDRFEANIERNIFLARSMEAAIRASSNLELLGDVGLNIVCFRYIPSQESKKTASLPEINALNEEIVIRLQESGVGVLSSTMLDGRFAIRAAITNHRTKESDVERILKKIESLGNELTLD